ncbi:MAG: septum formation initiator family protein, partial [Pseudomonadota bacterium]
CGAMDRGNITFAHGPQPQVALPGDPVKRWGALMFLLVLSALAIAGPWGALAWHDSALALGDRSSEIALLEEEIAALENRVQLLDPEHVDPDFAGELARRNLGVLHADEVVITLPED